MKDLVEVIQSGTDWDRFEELVKEASDAELAALFTKEDDRRVLLDNVFEYCYGTVQVDDPPVMSGVVHWHVRGPDEGGDYFQLHLDEGKPIIGRTLDRAPGVSIEIDPGDLLRVAAGETTSLGLMLDGRIKVEGDRLLAAHLGYLFT